MILCFSYLFTLMSLERLKCNSDMKREYVIDCLVHGMRKWDIKNPPVEAPQPPLLYKRPVSLIDQVAVGHLERSLSEIVNRHQLASLPEDFGKST